jgi:hypothetical protein
MQSKSYLYHGKMKFLSVIFIGALISALNGVGIFFALDEPYKVQIFMATILKGMLTALLIGYTIEKGQVNYARGLILGTLYGFFFGLVIFLAKGGMYHTTPYVIPSSIVTGLITGLLIVRFGMEKGKE